MHGFLRYPDGSITAFDPPDSTYTAAVSINKDAAVAGFYYDSRSDIHGFVRRADGTITTFDVDRATSTQAASIDDHNRIAGFALDRNFTGHGFLRLADGTVRTFDPPESAYTNVESIDHGTRESAITGESASATESPAAACRSGGWPGSAIGSRGMRRRK